MSKRERRITDLLNVAMAGAEAAVTVAASAAADDDRKTALSRAQGFLAEARGHLVAIQFLARQL